MRSRSSLLIEGLPAAELRLNDLAGALQLSVDRGVHLALQGAHDRAAAPHAAIGLDVAMLDAADLCLDFGDRRADGLEVGRVDEHGDAAAVGDAPQRAADRVEHALGLHGERAREDLRGERERQRDRIGLGLRGQLLAQRQRLGERLAQGARGGAGLGKAVLVAPGETLGETLGAGELADALGLGGRIGEDA